jgi:hypothetical protein
MKFLFLLICAVGYQMALESGQLTVCKITMFYYHLIDMLAVHPSANNHTTGSWVPLSRPHGPCSSSWEEGAGTITDSASSVNHTLRWDQHRAGYIQRKLSSGYIRDQQLEPVPCPVEQISSSGGAVSPDVGGGSVAKVLISRSYTLDPSIRGIDDANYVILSLSIYIYIYISRRTLSSALVRRRQAAAA